MVQSVLRRWAEDLEVEASLAFIAVFLLLNSKLLGGTTLRAGLGSGDISSPLLRLKSIFRQAKWLSW